MKKMFDTVECPYCGEDNDMSDGLVDLPSDNKFDHECECCEQEFEVFVEFHPSYGAEKIVYEECERCGELTREPRKKGRVFPFPDHFEKDVYCHSCYRQGMKEVYENKKMN